MYLLYLTLKTPNLLIALGILIYIIALAFVSSRVRSLNKYRTVRILCVVPVVVAGIHFFRYLKVFVNSVSGPAIWSIFSLLYIEALISLLFLFYGKSSRIRLVRSVISPLAALVVYFSLAISSVSMPYVHDYTSYSFTKSFTMMLNTLEKEYCLNSWKQIDYDALRNKYYPLVEEAERNNDQAAYLAVIREVAYRFYDSHVSVAFVGDMKIVEMLQETAGNDYGFSLIRIDDGSIIAVCVEPGCEAEKLGIHNGTTITMWNHQAINEAVDEVECIGLKFPVKENEDVFRPVFLAGKGGDEIDVTLIDEEGNEKEVSVHKIDSYENRSLYMRDVLLNRNMESHNFYTCMLDAQIGYLQMSYERNNAFEDNISVIRQGYYPQLTERYAKCIAALQNQGMKYLIIDLRNNSGGYDSVAGALASLFTEEESHMVSFGYEDSKGYHVVENEYIFPDGRYKDIPVVVLVNNSCISAGDGMAKFLGDCPNVTLMGITSSSGVNQNTGGKIELTPFIELKYPIALSLGADGKPLIDTDYTRTNNIPLDVQIPITREVAIEMFAVDRDLSADYELTYAMDYLSAMEE